MGKSTIKNNAISFYEPVDIGSQVSISPYWTCPADGYVTCSVQGAGAVTGIYLDDDTTSHRMGIYSSSQANNTVLSFSMPVIKGHIYRRSYFAGQSNTWAVLYYQFK